MGYKFINVQIIQSHTELPENRTEILFIKDFFPVILTCFCFTLNRQVNLEFVVLCYIWCFLSPGFWSRPEYICLRNNAP